MVLVLLNNPHGLNEISHLMLNRRVNKVIYLTQAMQDGSPIRMLMFSIATHFTLITSLNLLEYEKIVVSSSTRKYFASHIPGSINQDVAKCEI